MSIFGSSFIVHRLSRARGFTMIELLVVISIIAVVFGIIATSILLIQRNARDAKRQSDLRSIQSALQHFYADKSYFPFSLPSAGTRFPSSGSTIYLQQVPGDPSGGANYGYQPLGSSCASDTDCSDGSCVNYCISYCLYAKLENPPSTTVPTSPCTQAPAGANFQLTQP